ncbi:Aldo/keto reductase [Cylindrobasidium torrendii FP15055 ss-10]|uniref:Aldo/keto reductase n=1 Tax=Cylindrobasidium torrendii FP15055 ss-10 TaxID=1314674 RepID=A0A0D7BBV8_9AGAR|nr:Aldo/keto reductase [Cylindrobasidium torrendii FP15055 ss-10]
MSSLSYTLNDGNTIPWLGFGTGTALYGKDASSQVKAAIDHGITHLDGAQVYQNEKALGEGIKASGKPRESLFVTTKFGPNTKGPTPVIRDTLVESLSKLGLDYVDLFLIHQPYPLNERGELKKTWQELEAIQKEGLAKSIGVSNYRVVDLKELLEGATVVPAVNQIEFHPYVFDTAEEIYEFSKSKGIRIASYAGLAPITHVKGGPVDAPVNAAAERLSKETGKTVEPAHVLTKWLLQKGIIVVTTTSKPERITATLNVPNLPDLTAEELKAIDVEGAKLHRRIYMRHVFGEAKANV